VWQDDVRVEAGVVESLEWCVWSDGAAWELTLEQASPGWRTILLPCSGAPGQMFEKHSCWSFLLIWQANQVQH